MPIAFFTRTQTGALISRLNNDVIGAQQAFTDLLSNVVGNLVLVVIVLVTMFILSWQITLVALVLLPIFLFPARRVGQRLGTMTRDSMELNAEMNMVMTERFNVSGAMLVEALRPTRGRGGGLRGPRGRGPRHRHRSGDLPADLLHQPDPHRRPGHGLRLRLRRHRRHPRHASRSGTVVALTAYLARLYGPLTQLSSLQVDVMTTLVSFERFFEVIDLEPAGRRGPRRRAHPRGSGPDRLRRRPLLLPDRRAGLAGVARGGGHPRAGRSRRDPPRPLASASSRAPSPRWWGRRVRARRPSRRWCRASTTLTPGRSRINGVDLRQATNASLRRHRRRRDPRRPPLPRHACGRTCSSPGPRPPRPSCTRPCEEAQIRDLVLALPQGLDTVVGERGYRLSGGEKQRVALARLLLKAPRVVVLDEATAHLDAESEAAVQRALAETLAGRTSLVIAHRLSTIRNADQILVIEQGRIVERGDHVELLAAGGLYADLYETQFRRQDEPDR